MTKEQIQESANKKTLAIQTLCKQLQIELVAKQIVTSQGFLESIVIFNDTEKYPEDEVKEVPEKVEEPVEVEEPTEEDNQPNPKEDEKPAPILEP